MVYDTIIIGGGPAGLSAALVLGRCCRRVLVVDAGRPRNRAAQGVHNFLTRDGVPPTRLRDLGRKDLARYGVVLRQGQVVRVTRAGEIFTVFGVAGLRARSRTVLLATGVADLLPAVRGLRRFYGRGVHHCPYCDAWEYRGRPIAALGQPRAAVGLGLSLLTWTPDVIVLTNGVPLPPREQARASRAGLGVRDEPIRRLSAALPRGGRSRPPGPTRLGRVHFQSGSPLEVSALFFNTDQVQRSRLPRRLGCAIDEHGGVVRDRRQRTGIPGLYLAGDASRDVQFAIVAASEGARAGVGINHDLQVLDRRAATDAQRNVRRP